MNLGDKGQAALNEAENCEHNFAWLKAAEFYEQILDSKLETSTPHAQIWQRIGYSLARASTQAQQAKDFEKLRQRAVDAYGKASELYEKQSDMKSRGLVSHCLAFSQYLGSWLATSPQEKREMLDRSIDAAKLSLKVYENLDDMSCYGTACNDIVTSMIERAYIASNSEEMRSVVRTGVDYACKAIEALLKTDRKQELLRAYSTGSLQCWYAANIAEEENQRSDLVKKSLDLSEKASTLSEEVNDPFGIAMSNWAASISTLLFTEKIELSLKQAEKMLEAGTFLKDNFLVGVAYYLITFVTNWMAGREEDPAKRREDRKKIIKFAKDAVDHLSIVHQDYFIAETCLFYAESYSAQARDAETEIGTKREMLEEAVRIGHLGLTHAKRSGSLDGEGSALHALSKALQFSSDLETRRDNRKVLLGEALEHRRSFNAIIERAFPTSEWSRGVGKSYEGQVKAQLSELETEHDKKIMLLENAIADMNEGITHCRKGISIGPAPLRIVSLGIFEDSLGDMLIGLYSIGHDQKLLDSASQAYENAATDFERGDLPSRSAEAHWKVAKNRDSSCEFQKASKSFENAFLAYKKAAEKVPHFAKFYEDHATYMESWNEIEKAKFEHEHEDYDNAAKHYQRASRLTDGTKSWSFLSCNFLAWSCLERAEELSRKEQVKESIRVFKQAAVYFIKAKDSFEKAIGSIRNMDEKEKALELSQASTLRKDYCLARIDVEEARLLDRKGEYAESAEKYDAAALMFEELLAKISSVDEKREIEALSYMCRAWQKMKLADRRASPALYDEASKLFVRAKERGTKDKMILLASGNGAFCKALEHGTEFEETRQKKEFMETKKFLGSAADYYLRAGFDNASLWTNATETLFDAYSYMINAEIEVDVESKMRTYLLAEKCLEHSAKLYEKAGYVGKRNEVLRTLDKAREKREFAMSLKEMLAAPDDASTTTVIPAPKMTREEPVGLAKFERELVQANAIASVKEVTVGGGFVLEVQLANLGKKTAFLTQIQQIAPEGFEIAEKQEAYAVQNGDLDMKAKQLEPLKTEEVRITLRALRKGSFAINPRIEYVDEVGHRSFCETEPLTVNVSEVALPGRIPTGFSDLDGLLMGGIPESCAILLTSPSYDERDLLIRRFLETGISRDEVTFHVTIDATGVKHLAEQFEKTFFVILCNPQADTIIQNLPNVFRLKGVENLTEINISLTSAQRELDSSSQKPKRICIEIISDILLQHHALATRRWLTALIPDLRSKGFTIFAVVNPRMHTSEETQAIQDIFDGEISIYEKETGKGAEKFIKVKKLYKHKYLDSELILKKDKLQNMHGANDT